MNDYDGLYSSDESQDNEKPPVSYFEINDYWIIFLDQKLGNGNFGTVYKG